MLVFRGILGILAALFAVIAVLVLLIPVLAVGAVIAVLIAIISLPFVLWGLLRKPHKKREIIDRDEIIDAEYEVKTK